MAELKLGTTIGGSVAWHEGNDGSGSGLDADYLDGNHASAFALSGHTHNYAGSSSAGGAANSVANSVTFTSSGGASAGTTFNGSAAVTIDYATLGAAASGHNHTYDVNNAWLRDANDDANVKLYGNTRQMAFRTDGTTEYASGVGGYAFAWMYGGDADSNRRMLLQSDGRLWTNYHGWLDTAFAASSHTHSYLPLSGGTMSGSINMAGTQNITYAGFAGIEYWNNSTWQVYIGTENNAAGARQNSRNGVHTWYNNGTQAMQLNTNNLTIVGSLSAASKSFLIPHPTKEGWKLRYGSLEGPENGVYIRGKLKGKNKIELPEYWTKLVDPDSITVTLTPIGKHQKLYVEDISNNTVTVANDGLFAGEINCFFVVYGERIDIDKLVVEYE